MSHEKKHEHAAAHQHAAVAEAEPEVATFGAGDDPHVEPFTYTPPTITASGTTWAQLQAGGASGHLERLIAANSFALPTIELLRAAKTGNLEDAYRFLRCQLEEFLSGKPMTVVNLQTNLAQVQAVFLALSTLCGEAGVLIAANPGTLGRYIDVIGNSVARRTWP